MSHTSLANYYTTLFAMAQHHKYSIEELENMIPFERDIYYDMLVSFLEKLEKEAQRT